MNSPVRQRRFELPRPFGRYHLKVVRLPISPSPHTEVCKSKNYASHEEYNFYTDAASFF